MGSLIEVLFKKQLHQGHRKGNLYNAFLIHQDITQSPRSERHEWYEKWPQSFSYSETLWVCSCVLEYNILVNLGKQDLAVVRVVRKYSILSKGLPYNLPKGAMSRLFSHHLTFQSLTSLCHFLTCTNTFFIINIMRFFCVWESSDFSIRWHTNTNSHITTIPIT